MNKRITELKRMIKEAKAEQKLNKSLIYQNSIEKMEEELNELMEKSK